MILLCPYCGHQLPCTLSHGMSSCVNCCRVFDSCKTNVLLSTAWLVRKRNITDPQYLVEKFNISEEDAKFLIESVSDNCFNHEEFSKLVDQKLKNCNHRKAS